MKYFSSVLLVSTLVASSASAFEFTGGDVQLRFGSLNGSDFLDDWTASESRISSNIAFDFGNGLGGQAGLSYGKFGAGETTTNGEVHLTYTMANGVVLGGALGMYEEDGSGYRGTYAAIEAAFKADKLNFEFALTAEDSTSEDYRNNTFVMDMAYNLTDRVDLLTGLHIERDSASSYPLTYYDFGADYDLTPSVALGGTVGQVSWSDGRENVATLNLTYKFGDGVKFKQRAFSTLFPLD